VGPSEKNPQMMEKKGEVGVNSFRYVQKQVPQETPVGRKS